MDDSVVQFHGKEHVQKYLLTLMNIVSGGGWGEEVQVGQDTCAFCGFLVDLAVSDTTTEKLSGSTGEKR